MKICSSWIFVMARRSSKNGRQENDAWSAETLDSRQMGALYSSRCTVSGKTQTESPNTHPPLGLRIVFASKRSGVLLFLNASGPMQSAGPHTGLDRFAQLVQDAAAF
jgi:hypothetical protein